MPGGVDEVYLVLDTLVWALSCRPVAADCGGRDGNAAFAFLFHPVGDSRAFVHFAYFVDNAAVKQDSLGASRFAGVDVRRYTDVSRVFDGSAYWGIFGDKVAIYKNPLAGYHQRRCANALLDCAIL